LDNIVVSKNENKKVRRYWIKLWII
jgi:hypothetical protein